VSREQGGLFPDAGHDRAALLARWLELTRDVLPGMAAAQRWPIHLDHCFMRVCLDAAFGAPWTATVRAPAVRHMTDAQLAAAVGIAESVARHPGVLPALDRASIEGRRAMKKS
jgi:hypothetical protein